MNLQDRIEILTQLGKHLNTIDVNADESYDHASHANPWFTLEHINYSIQSIADNYLDKEKLEQWVEPYKHQFQEPSKKRVGLVMAGNIPLVGFHDFLSAFISGQQSTIKLSAKDNVLFKLIYNYLYELNPTIQNYILFVDRLEQVDAVIATGSNNSSRYFKYYFGKYPNIIRKNRTSVAVLNNEESEEDFKQLGVDLFMHFGLGCRNVSKLFVPSEYDFIPFLDSLKSFESLMDHNKYKNNYDYQRTLLLMNQTPHLASDFFMISNNTNLHAPISTAYSEAYISLEILKNDLKQLDDQLQCVVSKDGWFENSLPFGETQQPSLTDYADHVNTLDFLSGI